MKKAIIAGVIGLVIIGMIIAFGQVFTVRYVDVRFKNAVTSTDKREVLELAAIDTHTNIFILDEKDVENRVESAFPDKSVDVVKIVRSFPNKVVIEVTERMALFRIQADTPEEKGYVCADRNFQRNVVVPESSVPDGLIEIKGFTVTGDFNVNECYVLRNLANAIISCGIREEALPQAVKEIAFDEGKIYVKLRVTDTTFVLNAEPTTIASQWKPLFAQYVVLAPEERDGAEFVA